MTDCPDAAPPKEENKVLPSVCPKCKTIYSNTVDQCPVCIRLGPLPSPPSDAAPVAWHVTDKMVRAALTTETAEGGPVSQDIGFGMMRLILENAALYAHPEDAPGGPWRSENISDDNRAWGPTVWDSRVDAEGYGGSR